MSDAVIPQQDAIRVFVNEGGTITIEQTDPTTRDECVIWFDARHAETLCRAIRAAAKEIRHA